MSIVKIKKHNENIFNIEVEDEKEISTKKPIMYRSKYSKSIIETEREMKNQKHLQHRTFGLPDETISIAPEKFLKKGEGICRYYEVRPKTSHSTCNARRPPVPKHNEINHTSSMYNLCEKNFKLINIKRAKSAVLRNKPEPKCFEQKPPTFIYKEKFAKVPKYLIKMKEQTKLMKEMELKEKEERQRKEENKNIRVITQEQKNKLLEGLKHNWHKLQEEYQKMPLLIDSVPKTIRKSKLEENLKSLERDICLLNNNSSRIFIISD
ncbi:hypothetical protein PVAND_000253 [Polypedilum vanderplanki]|uniref:Enkurin domain-containing protein n=1 Tax=Polypedilum vanderplanki TaxID=319348 RepID=A0A9J6BJF1_POLVA|nr:hypothetical protein PVAND_000253 [Polypedilum vanderplanki]